MENLKRKRSKWIIALALPVILCVFVVGWAMYWLGASSKPVKTKPIKISFVTLEATTVER